MILCLRLNVVTKRGKHYNNNEIKGGSPGLVVMVDGSCSKGHGFESQRGIDGHFSH